MNSSNFSTKVMYDRNSFTLLKAKVSFHELFRAELN